MKDKKRGRRELFPVCRAVRCRLWICQGEQQRYAVAAAAPGDRHLPLHLFHHGLDADQPHLGALCPAGIGLQRGIGESQARLALLPQVTDGDRAGRVGIFQDIGGNVVENAPDIGPVDPQGNVIAPSSSRQLKPCCPSCSAHSAKGSSKIWEKGAGSSRVTTVSRVTRAYSNRWSDICLICRALASILAR